MLDTLKENQMNILCDVDKICRSSDINYSLAGGSLLGAVRHKGYIPWDDDIDIMICRENYHDLLDLMCNQFTSYEVYSCEDKNKYIPYLFSKVSIKGTKLNKDEVTLNEGINIDVFPIDSLGNSKLLAMFRFYLIFLFRQLSRIKYSNKKFDNIIFIIGFKILKPIFRVIPDCVFHRLITALCSKKSVSESKYAMSIGSRYVKKEFVTADLYKEYSEFEFEGKSIRGIRNADKYLTMMYGDYMVIPNVDNRENHNYSIVD